MDITFKQKDCPSCGSDLNVLVDGISGVDKDGGLTSVTDLDVLSVSCYRCAWVAQTEEEVGAVLGRDYKFNARQTEHDEAVRRASLSIYDCNMCGETHTRDEVILKANKDLLSALEFMAEYGEIDEDSLLLPVQGAVIHALDELQLLGVEGFKHPEDED